MNDSKFKKLFELARGEKAPAASEGFERAVLLAIRREGRAAPLTWWDQLGQLFPRLAVAALLVIGVCTAAEFLYTSSQKGGTTGDLSALSEQLQANNWSE